MDLFNHKLKKEAIVFKDIVMHLSNKVDELYQMSTNTPMAKSDASLSYGAMHTTFSAMYELAKMYQANKFSRPTNMLLLQNNIENVAKLMITLDSLRVEVFEIRTKILSVTNDLHKIDDNDPEIIEINHEINQLKHMQNNLMVNIANVNFKLANFLEIIRGTIIGDVYSVLCNIDIVEKYKENQRMIKKKKSGVYKIFADPSIVQRPFNNKNKGE